MMFVPNAPGLTTTRNLIFVLLAVSSGSVAGTGTCVVENPAPDITCIPCATRSLSLSLTRSRVLRRMGRWGRRRQVVSVVRLLLVPAGRRKFAQLSSV